MSADRKSESPQLRVLGGRRPRLADIQVQERMLEAGHEVVEEHGLTVSLDHLSFEEVIQRAGVSRSAAYRLWPYKDSFNFELLHELAGARWRGTSAFDDETMERAKAIVRDNLNDLRRADGRRRLLRKTIREAARPNFFGVRESQQWRTYVALMATLLSLPEDDTRAKLEGALQEAEAAYIQQMVEFLEHMASVLGLRMRSAFQDDASNPDFSALAVCGAAVVEGLGLRSTIVPNVVHGHYKLEATEGSEEWTLAAVGFMGIVNAMMEEVADDEYDFDSERVKFLEWLSKK